MKLKEHIPGDRLSLYVSAIKKGNTMVPGDAVECPLALLMHTCGVLPETNSFWRIGGMVDMLLESVNKDNSVDWNKVLKICF